MLRFSPSNAKTIALYTVPELNKYLIGGKRVYSFDLLSGYSCPYAKDCLSKAVVTENGRHIQDGPDTQFRCFSATQELVYPGVYNLRRDNFDTIRNTDDKFSALNSAIPEDLGICRIHVGGDFFSYSYMMAWAMVAINNPDILFYAYTKSLKFWVRSKLFFNSIPNFVLTASIGGRHDALINQYNLRTAKVVYHPNDTSLEIDHDDSHAAIPEKRRQNFALLIHGVQPKGSEASKALNLLKKQKQKFSYARS